MNYINEKLLFAFGNGNLSKMNKYLLLGANPTINDGFIYKYSVMCNNTDVLLLLLQFNKEYVNENDDIIITACTYNSVECIKILSKIINKQQFEKTDILTIINQLGQ